MLILHIIIASLTVILSGLLIFKPSQRMIKLNLTSLVLTLTTGTLITMQLQTSLTSACVSGLAITALAAVSSLQARYRLAAATRHYNQ